MLYSTRNDSQTQECLDNADQRRRGATLMEYLMMLSLIIVVCLIGIGYVGQSNSANLNSTSTSITKALKKGG
jgi:uncharacterized protein (UPF0333 family)